MRCPQCQSEFASGTHCPFDGTPLAAGDAWGARAASKPDEAYVGRVLDARYRVVERLGEGSMALVFKGEDLRDGQAVAIKILKPTRDEDLLARFRREAQVVSRLESPHAVRLRGFGEQGNTPYLVMEHLEGATLETHLARGPLSARRTLTILREVLAALEEAHGYGLIHRDLKPANIFLTHGGTAKVLDFGIAKVVSLEPGAGEGMMALAQPLTQMGAVMGTPTYMAPEQARGEPLDARTDLYALGVVAYHAITGKPPFEGSPGQVIFQHTHKAPPPLPASVDPRISALIARLLAKEPSARPPSAAALRGEIELVLGLPTHSGSTPLGSGGGLPPPPPRWGLRLAVVLAAAAVFSTAALFAARATAPVIAAPPPPGLIAVPLED